MIKIFTDQGITGIGECFAFPMIVGETQNTCYEMGKDFAALWKGKDPLIIEERLSELHLFTAGNSTSKVPLIWHYMILLQKMLAKLCTNF